MTQNELEKLIDERSQKQIADAKEAIKNEMGGVANITDEKKFNEAVEKAVSNIMAENKKSLDENIKVLEQFEKANAENSVKGLKQETAKSVVNEMIGSYLKAMNDNNRMNAKQVSADEALSVAKKLYPNSKALHAVLGQKTLTVGTSADGGFTVPTAFSPDYIKALYANTILEKLGVRKVPMPNGNFHVPKMTASASAYWVGEAQSITASQQTFAQVDLTAKKLACLTPISNELLRYNAVGIDGWVADDLMMKARIALDDAFLHGTGSNYQPTGLENANDVQTYSGSALSVSTPAEMLALLKSANVPMDNVKWLMNPMGEAWLETLAFSSGPFAFPSLDAGKLKGYDIIESSTVGYDTTGDSPVADFWVGDFSQLLWGVGQDISIEMTREGSFTDGDGNTLSAFQNDLTLVRLITEHDFACRNGEAFVKAELTQS